MTGVDLRGTNLEKVDFENASFLFAAYDNSTIFPDGNTADTTIFDIKGAGMSKLSWMVSILTFAKKID